MDDCCICLEKTDEVGHFACNHVFHKECLEKLQAHKYNRCPMCKSNYNVKKDDPTIDYSQNVVFNNMSDTNFNLNRYMRKWEKKDCFTKNHKFLIETLGDWNLSKNPNEVVSFSYKVMYIRCRECGVEKLIK